ncbi:MAG: hypothetical protein AAF411_27895, partial [Myxococcota bacterium]
KARMWLKKPLRRSVITKLRLDARTLLEFENGNLPADAVAGDQVPALASALAAAPARRIASLSIHANVPYKTTALVIATLSAANISELAFAVRPPGAPTEAFLHIRQFATRAEAPEPFEFPSTHMPAWNTVGAQWEAMYAACRENHYVDCEFKPTNVAEGGETHITLFARGNGVKIDLHRIGDPIPEATGGGGPALIDGIAAPVEDEVVEAPPATNATFTWRFNATTDADSPVSKTMRPLCGATACNALITAEAQTQTMRILSFIGAAFPTGTEAPFVVFQIPAR